MDYTIKPATAADEPFLWEMLHYAAHVDEDEDAPAPAENPALRPYIEGWGRAGDLGYVAVSGASNDRVGAAWARPLPATYDIYRVVPEGTPELAIAVRPDALGRGIGTALLRQLLEEAPDGPIALTVRRGNPAARLYERLGFRTVGEITNRVGTVSDVMVAGLDDG